MDQAQALRELMAQTQKGAPQQRIITVTSGKGGVGKSVFSVNLAIALMQMGKRVLIIDADFGLANVDVMLGVTPEFDLSHVITRGMDIRDVICEGASGVKFISGGSGVAELINLNEEQLKLLIGNLLQLENLADIIIFDTGAGVSDNIIRLMVSSTEAIVVTTPEPTAMVDAYALIKTIVNYEDRPPLRLIVNRAENVREAKDTIDSFASIALKYMGVEIDKLGFVLSDPQVTKAIRKQQPLIISSPHSHASINIKAIAYRFMEQPQQPTRRGLSGFLNRFLRRGKEQELL